MNSIPNIEPAPANRIAPQKMQRPQPASSGEFDRQLERAQPRSEPKHARPKPDAEPEEDAPKGDADEGTVEQLVRQVKDKLVDLLGEAGPAKKPKSDSSGDGAEDLWKLKLGKTSGKEGLDLGLAKKSKVGADALKKPALDGAAKFGGEVVDPALERSGDVVKPVRAELFRLGDIRVSQSANSPGAMNFDPRFGGATAATPKSQIAEVAQQTLRIRPTDAGGSARMSMELDDGSRLDVSVEVRDGVASVKFNSSRVDAAHNLVRAVDALVRALHDAGLDAAEVEVDWTGEEESREDETPREHEGEEDREEHTSLEEETQPGAAITSFVHIVT